jgi:hypothetical protein
VGNIGFGSASGAITLSSGTITLAAAQTTTVDNAADTIGSVLAGAATSFTKNGTGALNLSGGGTVGNLIVSKGAVNVTAGNLAASGGFSNLGNTASTTGVVSVSSGATLGWTGNNGGNFAGASGASGVLYNSGTFNQSATTVNNAGIYLGNAANSYGYLRNSGNTTIGGRLWIAQAANAAGATGVLDITAGTVSVNPTGNFTAGQRLEINDDNNTHTTSASYAGVNVVSGTLTVGGNAAQTNINTGQNEYTSINITNGGKFTAGNAGTDSGFGLSVTNIATNTATLSIANGGTLEASYIYNNNALGTGVITFDNGTIRSIFNNAQGLIQGTNTKTYIQSGGATFDTNGYATLVPNALLAPTGSGLTGVTLGGTLTGYVGAPVVKITGGGGQGAAAIANFDPATGTITGITITSAGSGYTSTPTITLVGGNGGSTGAGAGTATATATIGAVTGGGLTKIGSGNLTLTGINTYSGATNVNNGTLTVNGNNSSTGLVTVASGATLAGTGTIAGATVINGALAGGLTLNNDSTINSGATAAALAFNGNIANFGSISSAVTVASGKTLTGNGSFGNTLTVNGSMTPGASGIGTNTITGNLAFGSSAQLSIVLGKTTAGSPVAGTDYGQVTAGGNVSLSGTMALTLGTGIQEGDVFYLIVNNGINSLATAFSGITVNGSLISGNEFTYNGQNYQVSYTADASAGAAGFSSSTGNDLAVAAVPEPGTWAMIVGGLGMLVSFQRNRRRK